MGKSLILEPNKLLFLLKSGSAIAFPTDTVPALAASPANAFNLWEIKKRPKTKPFILMGASAEQLFPYVLDDAINDACEIAFSYWPGAITMVLPVIADIALQLNPYGDSIGMRVPACKVALDFLQISGPLATTSANLSGYEPLMSAEAFSEYFPDLPLLAPTPWPQGSGLASTLIKWQGKGHWQLLRRGAVIPSVIAS